MTLCKKKAFTLVEILVAAGVTAIFLGMAVSMFIGFGKNFSAGEGSAVLMQECALFVARLRNDLNNAVKDNTNSFITIDENQIKLNVYDSEEGKVKPVIYSAVAQANGYYNMTRRVANGSSRPIVNGKIASFSWQLKEEVISTGTPPIKSIKRYGVEIDLKMGSSDLKNKSFDFKTIIYPIRVNKMR